MLPVFLCGLALLSACDDGAADGPDAHARLDAETDLPLSPLPDAGVDAATDAALDATPDAAVDPNSARAAAIEALYAPWVAADFFPTVSIALVDAEGARFLGLGDGLPGVEPPDLIFEIGSISKVFTGLLLARQVEAGQVALDTPIEALLPEALALPPSTAAITLEALVTHTSGLPRLPDNMPFGDPLDPYVDYGVDLLHAFLAGFEAPGEAPAAYSNLGVGLLGHLLGRAAGVESWQAALTAEVLEPLGMPDTRSEATDPDRLLGGHTADAVPTPGWSFTDALGAAGALRSTARDMARFAQAQLADAGPLADAIAISQAPLTTFSPGIEIGHGWLWLDAYDALFHDGGTGGFVSFIAVDKAAGRAVVVLQNGASPAASNALGLTALQLWRGEPVEAPPTPPEEVELTTAQLDVLVGVYEFAGTTLTVERREERLFVQLAGQQALGIYPLSEVLFYLRAVDAQLRFDVFLGEAARVVLSQNGAQTVFERVE